MMATKCAPLVGLAVPALSSVAKATSALLHLAGVVLADEPDSPPVAHEAPGAARSPPLANITPICAFQAHTKSRHLGLVRASGLARRAIAARYLGKVGLGRHVGSVLRSCRHELIEHAALAKSEERGDTDCQHDEYLGKGG